MVEICLETVPTQGIRQKVLAQKDQYPLMRECTSNDTIRIQTLFLTCGMLGFLGNKLLKHGTPCLYI